MAQGGVQRAARGARGAGAVRWVLRSMAGRCARGGRAVLGGPATCEYPALMIRARAPRWPTGTTAVDQLMAGHSTLECPWDRGVSPAPLVGGSLLPNKDRLC